MQHAVARSEVMAVSSAAPARTVLLVHICADGFRVLRSSRTLTDTVLYIYVCYSGVDIYESFSIHYVRTVTLTLGEW